MNKLLLCLLFLVTSAVVAQNNSPGNDNDNRPPQSFTNNGQGPFKFRKVKIKDITSENHGGNTAARTIGTSSNKVDGSLGGEVTDERIGELTVNEKGAAVYDLSIKLPPGINGVKPSVGLTYNSQSKNGVAGYGWNIKGVSLIKRIGSTEYYDGNTDPFDYDGSDRFALDGQRLILKSGTYGASGAVYELENHSNVKIESFSTYYSGPDRFKVSYPDGSVAWYGKDAYSKSREEYGLTYWENPQGIRISYEYAKLNNKMRLTGIKYGAQGTNSPINEIVFNYGNRSRTVQEYKAGYRYLQTKILTEIKVYGSGSIYRTYELDHSSTDIGYERISKITEYNSDHSQSHDPIIFNYNTTGSGVQSVDVSYDDQYGLALQNIEQRNSYATSFDLAGNGLMDFSIHPKNAIDRDHFWIFKDVQDQYGLTSAWEVDTNGDFEELFPTKFLASTDKLMSGQGLGIIQNTSNYDVKFIMYSNGTASPIYYQYERVWDAPTYTEEISCDNPGFTQRIPQEYIQGDFNGDGLTDVLAISRPYSNQACYPVLSSPDDPCGFQPLETDGTKQKSTTDTSTKKNTQDDTEAQRIPIEDDCCRCEMRSNNTARVTFINLDRRITSGFASSAGYLSTSLGYQDQLKTADFNGDGKTDIIHLQNGKLDIYTLGDNGNITLLWSVTDSEIDLDFPQLFGDYNGDGMTDIMIPTTVNTYSFRTFLSTAKGFVRYTASHPFKYIENDYTSSGSTKYSYNLIATDTNGDGITDIIDYRTSTNDSGTNGTQTVRVYKNMNPSSSTGNPNFVTGEYAYKFGDLEHFPIPIFLGNNENNNNLDFAAISDDKATAFKFNYNNSQASLLTSIYQQGLTEDIFYYDLSRRQMYGHGFGTPYTGAHTQDYPLASYPYAPGFFVVDALERSGGNQPLLKKIFSYKGATGHATGMNYFGFEGMSESNWYETSSERIHTVHINNPELKGANMIKYTTDNYVNFSSPTNYFIKTENTFSSSFSPSKVFTLNRTSSTTQNSLTSSYVNTDYYYDSYNNVTKQVNNYLGGINEQVEYQLNNNPSGSPYLIGQKTQKNISTKIDGHTFTKEEQYTYSNTLLTQKKVKGHNTGYNITNFTYDTYGNITEKSFIPSGESGRTTSYDYDTTHRFIVLETDPDNLETTRTYDATSGKLLSTTDHLDKTTAYEYDKWFRVSKITDSYGNEETITYLKSNNEYTVTKSSTLGTVLSEKYDLLNRLIRKGEKDVTGQMVYVQYDYDKDNQLIGESAPYTSGGPSLWETAEFDKHGRLSSTTTLGGKNTTYSYSDLDTTIDDGVTNQVVTLNALGMVDSKTTAEGTINYTYFGNGELKQSSYNGNSIVIEQDGWGRRTKMTDPDAGIYQYEYNGYGELTREVNPNGEHNYTYTPSGRILTEDFSGLHTDMDIIYQYQSSTKLLTSKSMINGNGDNITYAYSYNSNNDLTQEKESGIAAEFIKNYVYNSAGQKVNEEFIAKDLLHSKTSSKEIKYTYVNNQIRTVADYGSNAILYDIEDTNAFGAVTLAHAGNGLLLKQAFNNIGHITEIVSEKENPTGAPLELLRLDYDFQADRGNLNSRYNSLFNWSESFTYDNLDRLTAYNDNSGNHTQTYDNAGRITQNSELGNYGYDGGSYQQSSLTFNLPGASYFNQFASQHINYNTFKRPDEITETGVGKVSYEYNANRKRYASFYGGTNSDKTQRRYRKHYGLDGSMEFTYDSNSGKTTFVTYIGGDAYTSPVIWHSEQGSSTANNYYYLHRDYQQTIVAITDEDGVYKEKRHFDAWGNIVKLEDGNGNTLNDFKILNRGYNGHEHFTEVGVIDMNGRIYDPVLHRFLSPDNYIQDPYNIQNYNRYGYTLNNPLKYTDHTGEMTLKGFLRTLYNIVGIVVGAVIAVAIFFAAVAVAAAFTSLFLGALAAIATVAVLGTAAVKLAIFIDRNVNEAIDRISDPDDQRPNTPYNPYNNISGAGFGNNSIASITLFGSPKKINTLSLNGINYAWKNENFE